MPILTAADQPTYFPNVTQSGAALSGLLAVAQSLCESSWGANRPLDKQSFTEIITINPKFRIGSLSYNPVSSTPTPIVQVRRHTDSWGRIMITDWFTLDSGSFSIDFEIGQLNLFSVATEAKVTYTAGFDFTLTTQEVVNIKAIAGVVVDWAARRFYGQLDSYLNNETGAPIQSFNMVAPDRYLETILRPLKKYSPRKSYG
jgi:hypothetical protein